MSIVASRLGQILLVQQPATLSTKRSFEGPLFIEAAVRDEVHQDFGRLRERDSRYALSALRDLTRRYAAA